MGEEVIDQIEFRWQPGRDMAPFAWSFSDARKADFWSSRLAGIFRPPIPNPEQGVPGTSFFYFAPGDGHAAFVWRQYEQDASRLEDDAARRALVARALVGTAEALTPSLAIATCHSSPLARLGPPPGQASSARGLSPLARGHLAPERATIEALDEAACQEWGLDILIAGALAEPRLPISVMLPATAMLMDPADSPQLLLLWGLWRTTAPLVTVPRPRDEPPAERGWSFSTYEPPLGSTGTGTLPDIVFRSLEQQGQPPLNARDEMAVLPRQDAGVPSTGFPRFGNQLVRAYRELGGLELDRLLQQVAAEHPDVDDRLGQTSKRLSRLWSPSRAAERPAPEPVTSTPFGESLNPDVPWNPWVAGTPPRDGARAAGQPDRQSAADVPRSAPADYGTGPGGQRDSGQPAHVPLGRIMDGLGAGPDDPEFARAREALRGRLAKPSASERSAARRLLPDCDWYIPALARAEPFRTEDALEDLFAIVVIPDINQAEVADELAWWVSYAPPEVVRGLFAAAYHASQETGQLLSSILEPVLAQRWLHEVGVRLDLDHPPAQARPLAKVPASRQRAHWLLFLQNQPNGGVVASVLAWVCLVLFVIIVLSSWRL
jgi:hypothetical protein